MSTIFLTGGTGFLGGYVCAWLLRHTDARLALMTRAPDRAAGIHRLYKAWQLHFSVEEFRELIERVEIVPGDLHAPELGLTARDIDRLTERCDSVLHIAASLNRKSAKACLNSNLRGTLSMLKLARHLADHGGLERYSQVSTVAVAGHRDREIVEEDDAIQWDRSDYDPYGRTKKFAEHMAHELLPDVRKTIFRPSIVMGDSRFGATTQFDMVRAFCTIADLPMVPLRPDTRLDIVNADWVGPAIAQIHRDPDPAHDTYHLSSGRHSRTAHEIARALTASRGGRTPRFVPQGEPVFWNVVRAANRAPRGSAVAGVGALMKVFWPYITYDTVFSNERAVAAAGAPVPFTEYCGPLYDWVNEHQFRYPHKTLPEGIV